MQPEVEAIVSRSRAALVNGHLQDDSFDASTAIEDVSPDPWPTLDTDAFHGIAGEWVAQIEPHTEADTAGLLVSFLSEIGTILGRGPHLFLDGCFHPLLFWPVTVGASSKSRKGTADRRTQALFQQADPQWTRGQCKGTLSTGEGLAYAVRDAEEEPDSDSESKAKPDPGVEDKRLHLVQGEFAAVLKVMSRDGNSLSGALRDAWDGQDLSPMTKRNRVRSTAPHIGIVGHCTRDELLRNLGANESTNGFGNRFAWFLVRRSKELPFPSAPAASSVDMLARKLRSALTMGRALGLLGMTLPAQDEWRAIYSALSADRPGLAGALLARAEAQVRRVAALYAVLDGCKDVDLVHLKAALAVWKHAEQSVGLLFGECTGDPIADAIVEAVKKGRMTDTDISKLFNRHQPAARLEAAKRSLQAAGVMHPVTIETGGRPVRAWEAGKGE